MGFLAFGYYDGTGETPSIASLNIGTNAGRVALVHALISSSASISSLTYAGEDLTPAADSDTAYTGSLQRAYAKAITATGSNSVAGSTPPAGVGKTLLAAVFDGIASIRSVTNGDTNGTAGSVSVTATTVAGDIMVLLGFDLGIYDTFTATGGATRMTGAETFWIGAYKTAVGSSTTITGTFAGGNRNHEWSVFVLTPTGGGGGAPVITGPSGSAGAATSTKTVAENSTAVHTFTADVAVTWSINGGADAAAFAINPSTGALTFASAPSYETPTDLGDTAGNNTYVVVVRATATSGGATADQTVTVTVSNVAEPPLAPTIGVATAGDQTVSIAFTAPVNTGKPSITGYTATLSPGGITKAGASSPIVFGAGDGIVNGTAYTGVVKATNSEGTGPDSAASNSVTPSAGGGSVKVPTVLLSRLLTPRS